MPELIEINTEAVETVDWRKLDQEREKKLLAHIEWLESKVVNIQSELLDSEKMNFDVDYYYFIMTKAKLEGADWTIIACAGDPKDFTSVLKEYKKGKYNQYVSDVRMLKVPMPK